VDKYYPLLALDNGLAGIPLVLGYPNLTLDLGLRARVRWPIA